MQIKQLIPTYLKHMEMSGLSLGTIKVAKYDLNAFTRYLDSQSLYHIEDLTLEVLQDYQQELAFRLTAQGRRLSRGTQSRTLSMLRGFTRFLRQKDLLVHDPGARLIMPKLPQRLPKIILSQNEIKHLMAAPDMRTNRGYRNRIILEVLYDTAIRRAELADIKINDLDLEAGYVTVTGKGDKDRVVPLSKRVCRLAQNYIMLVRPEFIQGNDPGYLVLNRWGHKMDPNGVWAVVKRCTRLAGIKKNVSTHTFRHTCATHMLKNGAPVRHIQEMLGHASLNSTQVYTRVTINDLKKIHAKYHPSEKMKDSHR